MHEQALQAPLAEVHHPQHQKRHQPASSSVRRPAAPEPPHEHVDHNAPTVAQLVHELLRQAEARRLDVRRRQQRGRAAVGSLPTTTATWLATTVCGGILPHRRGRGRLHGGRSVCGDRSIAAEPAAGSISILLLVYSTARVHAAASRLGAATLCGTAGVLAYLGTLPRVQGIVGDGLAQLVLAVGRAVQCAGRCMLPTVEFDELSWIAHRGVTDVPPWAWPTASGLYVFIVVPNLSLDRAPHLPQRSLPGQLGNCVGKAGALHHGRPRRRSDDVPRHDRDSAGAHGGVA